MKNMKKIVALLVAVLMLLGMVSAFAAGDTGTDPANYANDGAPYKGNTNWDETWNNSIKDGSISVGGLSPNDQVKFYQVLAYDQDAHKKVSEATSITEGAGSWKVIDPFASVTGANAITLADFKAILSEGISSTLAGKIAKTATGTPTHTATANSEGVATYGESDLKAGLYVAIVVPAAAGWMYNPIFVASDYYTTAPKDMSSNWTAAETPLSYSDRAMAKKSPITITKEATEDNEDTNEKDDAKAVGVGDVINFKVDTTIPEFADNYLNPLFIVKDQLTSGLEFVENSLHVYTVDGSTETEISGTDKFTVTYATTPTYKVTFTPAYILSLAQATDIRIRYQAKVTETAVTNVNEEDNTVTLEYSHTPEADQEGEGKKIRDKTHHYTFTIDGNIWGSSEDYTTEVVKVGLDKDGNEITETYTIAGERKIGALANAEFKLYVDNNGAPGAEYSKGPYKASSTTESGNKIVSDANGRLKLVSGVTMGIPGLDAGTYWLVEEKAPEGYIKQQAPVKIEITATYWSEFTFTETEGSDTYEITCDDVLKSYKVEIDGKKTAEYTLNYTMKGTTPDAPVNDIVLETSGKKTDQGDVYIANEGPIRQADTGDKKAAEELGKIKNTQGVELPSTGGMGTTILYIGGSILVILAAVLLITKRRMNAED